MTGPEFDAEHRIREAFSAYADEVAQSAGEGGDPASFLPAGGATSRTRRTALRAPAVAAAALVVVLAGLLALFARGGSHSGSPGASAPTSVASVAPSSAPGTAPSSVPSSAPGTAVESTVPAQPQIGVRYRASVPSHCGIKYVSFAGQLWRAVRPIPEPPARPDAQGHVSMTGQTPGTLVLVDRNTLRFDIDTTLVQATTTSVIFHPTGDTPPLCL